MAGAPPVAQAATRRPDQRDLHAGSGAARMGQARVQNEMSSSAGPVDAQAPHAQQRGEDAGGPARQVMQEPAGVPHLKWERAGDAHSAAAATGKPAPTSDRSRSERRADVHHARGYALRKKVRSPRIQVSVSQTQCLKLSVSDSSRSTGTSQCPVRRCCRLCVQAKPLRGQLAGV